MSKLHSHMSVQDLIELIKESSQAAMHSKQVSDRLKELLREQLNRLKNQYRYKRNSAARAERLSYVDPIYVEHVERLVDIRSQAQLSRIQYETSLMLYQSRQSLRAFQKFANR